MSITHPFRWSLVSGLMVGLLAELGAPAALRALEQPLFPADQICSPTVDPTLKTVDPLRLIRWLIAVSEVSDAALDADGDGDTLLEEKQLALVQPDYCTRDVGRACTPEDAETLARVQERLADFVERLGGTDYVFERIRRPSVEEWSEAAFLNPFLEVPGRRVQVAELLDVSGRFVKVYCTSPEPEPPAQVADVATPEIVEAPEKPDWIFNPRGADGLRLTSEIDDLNKDRDQLTAVRPAELSITADLDDDETRYQVKAIAGYNFEVERSDSFFTSTTPFFLIERFFNGASNEIDKLGLGVQEALRVEFLDGSSSEFAITPLYLTDSDFNTDIGILKLRWTPTLAPDSFLPIGFPKTLGPVSVQLSIDTLADIGQVFDDGGNSDLENESEFLRVGGRLGTQLRGGEDTWFKDIELDVSNRYLKSADGDIGDLYRLDVSISYLFSQAENYRLSFSYANGRTDDTLENTEYWKTQFGVRF